MRKVKGSNLGLNRTTDLLSLPDARQEMWMSQGLRRLPLKTDALRHGKCGTLKHCSMTASAEQMWWWRLHVSENFSGGTKNNIQTNKYFLRYISIKKDCFSTSVSNTLANTFIKWHRNRIPVVLRQCRDFPAKLGKILALPESPERLQSVLGRITCDCVLRLRDVELPVWDPRSRERRSFLDVSWRLLPIPVLCQTNFHTHILHANKQNVFFLSILINSSYLKRTNAAIAYNYCWYGVIQSKASN